MAKFSQITPKFNLIFFSLSLFISSVFVSWVILAQVNFGYSVLYPTMNIDQHITKYGPQNRYRRGFELTDKAEHKRLFATIVDEIHNDGANLAKIVYRLPNSEPVRTLLRKPEVVHLQDVAHLINQFYVVAIIAIVITLIYVGYFNFRKIPLPSIKQQAIGIISFCGVCTLLILLIGPVKVFYALHEWIFPDNHQWFFYYQESLMTILMKAPDLFGAITAFIAILAIAIYLGANRLLHLIEYKKSKK
ncbi:MAG: DUF1461 domain-containing protein [Gammaproteobacteria bacterium]|nr:DUF1461 domain-containing protein [Gammaproteobacteria bacterium]